MRPAVSYFTISCRRPVKSFTGSNTASRLHPFGDFKVFHGKIREQFERKPVIFGGNEWEKGSRIGRERFLPRHLKNIALIPISNEIWIFSYYFTRKT